MDMNLGFDASPQNNFEESWEIDEKIISEHLNSKLFLDTLHTFELSNREAVIGLFIEFLVLFPKATKNDVERFVIFLGEFRNSGSMTIGLEFNDRKKFNDYIIDYAWTYLSDGNEGSTKKVEDYFIKFDLSGVFFHGFNGAFEDSVRGVGLSAEKRDWDWEEWEAIESLLNNVGLPRHLGLGKLDQGHISVAATPRDSYSYACGSPEWFMLFIGRFSESKLFIYRDYKSVKQDLEILLEKNSKPRKKSATEYWPSLSSSDCEKVRIFFEKYWKIFANEKAKPKLAIFSSENQKQPTDSLDRLRDVKRRIYGNPQSDSRADLNFRKIIASMIPGNHGTIGHRLDESVDPSILHIVDLPDPKVVYSDDIKYS